jgi:transposase
MVRMAREQGMTRDAVAAVVPCSKRTVTRILSLFRNTGDVVEQHGGGRAHAYSPRQMQRLHQLVLQNPHATAAGLVGLMGPNAPHISERTMCKYIRELNISRRREGTESFDTPRYIALRTAWAHQHRDDDILSWMFMDASTLMLRHTGDYVWAPKGEPTPPHSVEHLYVKVNVWGIVWNNGSIFAQFHGQLNSRKTYNLLIEHLVPLAPDLAGRTLVADGVRYQWTKEVLELYDEAGIIPLKLPPRSPRFTAIERCWGWIKKNVKRQAPATRAQLQQAMTNACNALPVPVIQGFIREARRHIRKQ